MESPYRVEVRQSPTGYGFELVSDEHPDYFMWMSELTPEQVASAIESAVRQVLSRCED